MRSPSDLERMVAGLAIAIKITPQTRNLFTISYRNTQPKLAYDVVQTMLSIFVESKTGNNRSRHGERAPVPRTADRQLRGEAAPRRIAARRVQRQVSRPAARQQRVFEARCGAHGGRHAAGPAQAGGAARGAGAPAARRHADHDFRRPALRGRRGGRAHAAGLPGTRERAGQVHRPQSDGGRRCAPPATSSASSPPARPAGRRTSRRRRQRDRQSGGREAAAADLRPGGGGRVAASSRSPTRSPSATGWTRSPAARPA